MKQHNLIFGIFAICLSLLSGCCGECNGVYLGEFVFSQETREWLNFANDRSRFFVNPSSQPLLMTYGVPEYTVEHQQYNCQRDEKCGDCCDEYDVQTGFVQLVSQDGTITFNITLQRDFLNFTPLNSPDEVGDYFTMTMNNKLTGELFLLNPVYRGRVTLNGKNYDNVFAVELDPSQVDPSRRDPAGFYFRKAEGILGFTFTNGEEWNLQ